jgi:signal recognition particle GTPase
MQDKETLQKEIYTPAKELKDKFYNAKTIEEWHQCKEELKTLLEKISEPLMTSDFATSYKKNLVDAIAKMWKYKEPYFNKLENKKQFQPKQSYILRENEGLAFTRLCNALADYLEKKL